MSACMRRTRERARSMSVSCAAAATTKSSLQGRSPRFSCTSCSDGPCSDSASAERTPHAKSTAPCSCGKRPPDGPRRCRAASSRDGSPSEPTLSAKSPPPSAGTGEVGDARPGLQSATRSHCQTTEWAPVPTRLATRKLAPPSTNRAPGTQPSASHPIDPLQSASDCGDAQPKPSRSHGARRRRERLSSGRSDGVAASGPVTRSTKLSTSDGETSKQSHAGPPSQQPGHRLPPQK
mmetsp:Transcript_25845/g.84759  ORF Transcript_25845/g.84759 Transcript_25845/m.84759 type:complete len:235 (-) Transcript_25845:66-770(-)